MTKDCLKILLRSLGCIVRECTFVSHSVSAADRSCLSPDTGLIASADNPNGILEKFVEGNLPQAEVYEGPNGDKPMNAGDKPIF